MVEFVHEYSVVVTEAATGGVPQKKMFLTGKHLCQSLFFNKVLGLRPATLLKKRLWYRCSPVDFAKFLRTPFLQNTSGRVRLLLPKAEVTLNSRKV